MVGRKVHDLQEKPRFAGFWAALNLGCKLLKYARRALLTLVRCLPKYCLGSYLWGHSKYSFANLLQPIPLLEVALASFVCCLPQWDLFYNEI